MSLILMIILATLLYTLYDVFASKASNGIDPNASATIFNGLGAVVPLLLLTVLRAKKGSVVTTTKSGVIYSVLAGVCIAAFSILFVKIFEKSNLSYVIPLIYGGTIVLASLVGVFLFHDKLNILQGLGLLVISVGVGMVVVSKL